MNPVPTGKRSRRAKKAEFPKGKNGFVLHIALVAAVAIVALNVLLFVGLSRRRS